MASGLLSAELSATCNSLGYYDGVKYHLEPHCKEGVKDIIRYLKRDEESHDIRRFLGNTKVVQTDLVPILISHLEDKELFDLVLRLVVNLTSPALLLYNEIVPTDKAEHNHYMELISHLQGYKEAMNDPQLWKSITGRLSELLGKEDTDDIDNQKSIERILILLRNVLHVPEDVESEWRPDNDASVHDQVIWALQQSGMLDLLLYLASSSEAAFFYLHILEIICLLVREQPPSLLANSGNLRSVDEKGKDDEELLRIRQHEVNEKQKKLRKYLGSRHSSFGGTYVVQNMKSTSDKDMIYHKPLHQANHITLDPEKKKVRHARNKQPLKCFTIERKSALSVRLILKQFCIEILNAAFNPLMRAVKDTLLRGNTHDNDESYYFTALRFFLEFNRAYKFQVKLVSETVSIEMFHFIQKYLETWHEMMTTDKKKIPIWSSRMHTALKAYKELLHTLMSMDQSEDASVRESSVIIKSNIFYVVEYREMLLALINTYKKNKYSMQYLRDLIETIHIFCKLLENFCKTRKLVVQKHVRKVSRKKKGKKNELAVEMWPTIASELETVLRSDIEMEVVPFDAASSLSIDEQKVLAAKRIQSLLKSGSLEEAVAHLRVSREVWPENDSFGASNLSLDDELECLKEFFTADLSEVAGPLETLHEENGSVDEEEEEELVHHTMPEQSFNVMDFIKNFANPNTMKICGLLLSQFDTNSEFTNHCIAKMFHRIAWDCKLPSMLFQASIFISFLKIFDSKDPKYKELMKLATYIVGKLSEVAEKNSKVFFELLFWKNSKEAYEIEEGYGSFQHKSKVVVWEEYEEEELRRLSAEYQRDKPSQDFVDWVLENLINQSRSKRSVTKKLKELCLMVEKEKPIKTWSDEQEQELIELFEKHKEEKGCLRLIMEEMPIKRSKKSVSTKLKELGCFLRKGASGGRKSQGAERGSSSSEDDSQDDGGVPRPFVREHVARPPLANSLNSLLPTLTSSHYLLKGLEWVMSAFEENLEDFEEGASEEVPLLPLSEEAMQSIDHPAFQALLLSLGFHRPIDQQERFWRSPATWSRHHLSSRLSLIKFILVNHHQDISQITLQLNQLLSGIEGKPVDMNNRVGDTPRERGSTDESDDQLPTLEETPFLKSARRIISSDESDTSPTKRVGGDGAERGNGGKRKSGAVGRFNGHPPTESSDDDNNDDGAVRRVGKRPRGKATRRGSQSSEEEEEEGKWPKSKRRKKGKKVLNDEGEDTTANQHDTPRYGDSRPPTTQSPFHEKTTGELDESPLSITQNAAQVSSSEESLRRTSLSHDEGGSCANKPPSPISGSSLGVQRLKRGAFPFDDSDDDSGLSSQQKQVKLPSDADNVKKRKRLTIVSDDED